jgi:hypothetical protein
MGRVAGSCERNKVDYVFMKCGKFLIFIDCYIQKDWMNMLHGVSLLFCYNIILLVILSLIVGRDSVVGIATRYGLDSPGIESP